MLNPKLHTLAFTKEVALKQALFSHGQALVLTHGSVIFEVGEQRVFGGPGTVLGLASELCRLPPFEVALAGSVNALALPLDGLLGELGRDERGDSRGAAEHYPAHPRSGQGAAGTRGAPRPSKERLGAPAWGSALPVVL